MDYKYATALEALIGYWYLCARADADEDNAAFMDEWAAWDE